MRMIGSRINFDILETFPSQRTVGKHPFDRLLERKGRLALDHFRVILLFQPPRIAGIPVINFIFSFPSGNADLFGIDHDDLIAEIKIGSIERLVFPANNQDYLCGESAQSLSRGIDEIPIGFYILLCC